MASPGVQSVDRALDLLEALGEAERSLSLAEVAQRTGLTPPTAHRLLRTMQARGYVNQHASREYSPGPALIALGRKATPALAVLAQPVLAELEEISGETANLAVLDRDQSNIFQEMYLDSSAQGIPAFLQNVSDPEFKELGDKLATAQYTTVEERRELPASAFGIPETREFPLVDAAHIRAAEAYFRYAPDDRKAALARRILARAREMGVDVRSRVIRGWAGEA